MASGIVVDSVQDALAVSLQILESAKEEVVWLIPLTLLSLSKHYDFIEKTRAFIQRGGESRGIVAISRANVEEIQTSLSIGKNVRHSDADHELFMFVGDRQYSISAINVGIHDFTLATPIVAFWSEDSVYAEYLLTSFENAWSHAVPAAKRTQELAARERAALKSVT